MADVLLPLLTIVFVAGVLAGLSTSFLLGRIGGWWQKPKEKEKSLKGSKAPKDSLNIPEVLPAYAFTSRTGRCYHLSPGCSMLRNRVGVEQLKLCEHCKSQVQRHGQ